MRRLTQTGKNVVYIIKDGETAAFNFKCRNFKGYRVELISGWENKGDSSIILVCVLVLHFRR